MPTPVIPAIDDPRLLIGIVEVHGGSVRDASPELQAACRSLTLDLCAPDFALDEGRRSAVRRILKLGGFSATGRNKPAHEFLLADLRERGEFNFISNCVDVNNYISLKHALPISILDAGKLSGSVVLRLGEVGESYVFNNAGHSMDLKQCLLLAHGPEGSIPTGNPVKDSMATKIFEGATDYLAVLYASTEGFSREQLQAACAEMAELLARETGGSVVQSEVLGAGS